ncbi:hypothetical protein IUY40_13865 [Flavobacterium sp. ALJ2]|uniref:hypothetical protein n=1 Tax=Flavobacterium sp. ALJ2 TaxID=2786960 RepID=UPI00189EC80A|nr:hypothetical protein [Flavobacterium sp. ALJ2]MBF7092618.1 hypothetical protein [Flavobacterium sp. ALJ2]
MKNLKLCLAILPLFTIACSEEYTGEVIETAHKTGSAKKTDIGPDNTANPFDIAGSIHNEILETLEQTNFNSQSVEEIAILIDSVSAVYPPELVLLSSNATLSTRVSDIIWIVNSNNAIDDVLAVSSLGVNAKTSLLTFVNSLVLASDDPYEDIHSMIISYEAGILSNTEFTSDDKRIILTTTSVARYSIYGEKRKDKDWETGVTKIAAAVSGAEECMVLGLKMALTVGLCHNNNITQ